MTLSAALLLALAAGSQAASTNLVFPVSISLTPALETSGNGEFLLDVQLAPGTNLVTNSVTLSNFVFTGGSLDASNANNFSTGGVSGSLSSSLTLTNTSNLDNEFGEAFTSGVTQVSFLVNQTTNSEPGSNPIDEEFNVYIDDNTGNAVPTTDPSSANKLISSVIEEGESIGNVNIYPSTSPETGVTAVPEPGSAAMLLVAAVGLCWRRRTFRRS